MLAREDLYTGRSHTNRLGVRVASHRMLHLLRYCATLARRDHEQLPPARGGTWC